MLEKKYFALCGTLLTGMWNKLGWNCRKLKGKNNSSLKEFSFANYRKKIQMIGWNFADRTNSMIDTHWTDKLNTRNQHQPGFYDRSRRLDSRPWPWGVSSYTFWFRGRAEKPTKWQNHFAWISKYLVVYFVQTSIESSLFDTNYWPVDTLVDQLTGEAWGRYQM